MCGQIAYDWNTMPNPRRLAGTNTPSAAENTMVESTAISPSRGRSSPAIERNVVVLPQPLGPSRVKNLPGSTSNASSCTARTLVPRPSAYSVDSARTLSMAARTDAGGDAQASARVRRTDASSESHPEPRAETLRDHHEQRQRDDHQHAERRQLDVLAVLPQLPDDDRQHLRSRAIKQDRARQLAN